MRRVAITLCLAVLTISPSGFGQNPQTGFPPFSSFQSTGFDAVNEQNLNAVISVSIFSIPARGQAFQYNLVNNSLLWTQTRGTPNAWTPVTDASGNPTWGWNYGPAVSGTGQILLQVSSHTCRYIDPDTGFQAFASYTIYSNFRYKDWLGTVHPFPILYTVASQNAQTYCGIENTPLPVTGYASDNTGFYMSAGGSGGNYVLDPAGVNAGAAPIDSNGNYLSQTVVNSSQTNWTDTAGHLALKVFTNSTNIQYQWADSSGNYAAATTTTVQLSTLPIKTNFACTGISEYTGSAKLPTEIDLPNGQKYVITYETTPANPSYYTGRVKRVTLPTGGYYEYDYPTTAGDGIVCADSSVNSLTRLVNDGTTTSTWTFSRSPSGSNWVTTVTAPLMPYDSAANNSVYTFNSSGQQITAQLYQGALNSANLKRTINTAWTSGAPTTQITILEDGQTQNEVETSFDSYGNILFLKEHDWGTGTPGSVLRTTTWTYLNSSPYITANILNRATRMSVADSAGTVHSRTDIAYDESGYVNSTCVTGAAQHNDTNFGCSFTTRGNPTTVTTYTNAAAPSGSITHHTYYDNLGNIVKADADCCQQKTWNYSATTNYSFPDSVSRGSASPYLTTSATYNAYTGLVVTSTDDNAQVTHYTYDNYKRPTNLQRPDSANLTWAYIDATPPTQSSITSSVPVQGSSAKESITTLDGLGHPVTQQITDGTTTYSIIATQYDPFGRAYKVSNPYTTSAQYWTASQFDTLGRPTVRILQDNSQTTFSYTANTTIMTDPAGKQRKSQVDGLGRMLNVWEPDPSNGNSLSLQTTYAYSVLDLLTGVTQGVQTRAYTFDDVGRPTSVKAPETNQVATQFQYNNFGLVTQRTDARGVITTYGYDTLNRLQSISYNVGTTGVPSTSSVSFTYGTNSSQSNNGRLITMSDGVGSENYSYDILGNMTSLQKVIGGTTYTTGYQYNLAGELTSITYPSTRVVQHSYDTIGRLCAVGTAGSTCTSGTTYAGGFSYNPAFQVTGLSYGNGVIAAFGYTADRLLLQSLAYTKGTTALFSTNYWYKTDSTNCPNGASGNNGQIQCITDSVDSGRTVSYSYDALYRLSSALTNGSANYPQWGLSWSYDRYGNRTAQTVTAGSAYSNSVAVNTSTNQIVGPPYAYDASGNMTNDGSNSLVYNAENRLLSATNGSSSGSYTYDAKNLRVKKVSGSTTTVYVFSGSRVIAEYDNGAAAGSPSREYIYSGGHLLAKIDSSGTKYYHQDHLSNRLVTDSTGNTLAQLGTYPYGDTWYNATSDKLFFTAYERDAESGNDYAMMRYGISGLARFSSPDPLSGSRGNPQSLNRYPYVHNDPINLTDPTGLIPGGPPKYECSNFDPVQMPGCGTPGDFGGGGGGMACYMDGILSPCGIVQSALGAGAAVQCPNNICEAINGDGQFVQFRAFADGSSGYLPHDAPAGYSVKDIANAASLVSEFANGTPIDPTQLAGRAKQVYDLLVGLGVSPENIAIYQNGTQSFAAVLTDDGFEELENSSKFASYFGDVALHYPYTDGGRSDQTPSLHSVWFDENLTDYVGGLGIYMQFHSDSSSPWNGGFWQHWGCDVLHLTCN